MNDSTLDCSNTYWNTTNAVSDFVNTLKSLTNLG